MLIVLAHYFASRRLVRVPPELNAQLPAQGLVQEEPRPLWLPRNSVRTLILGALIALVVILFLSGGLFDSGVFDNLFLIGAYLTGVVVQFMRQRRGPRALSRWGRTWVHLKALTVVLACALIITLAFEGPLATLPTWVEQGLLGWVLFYFGSR